MRERFSQLMQTRKPGWSLPREFYTDSEIYQAEVAQLWRRQWLFVGHSCEAGKIGDYFTYEIDDDSVILVRQEDLSLKAFFNTCRHRGSQLVCSGKGHAKSFVCPYHQWSYGKEGNLINTGGTTESWDKTQFSLHACHVQEVAGLVYLCLHPEPPDFSAAQKAIVPQLKPHGLEHAKVAHSEEYVVKANWKLVWENNRECFHCRLGHPEYIRANYDIASPNDPKIKAEIEAIYEKYRPHWAAHGIDVNFKSGGVPFFPTPGVWWRSVRTVFREGFVTQSLDGKPVSRLMGNFTSPHMGNLRVSTLPNLWHHANSDHSVSTRVTPVSADQSLVKVSWLVHEDAVEGKDYTLERLTPMWKLTGEQDWRLCEVNQAGVKSSRYRPGPYSMEREYNVDHFVNWYLDLMKD